MATSSVKMRGSAASARDYYKDEEATLGYYKGGSEKDGFDTVWGELGRELGLEHGITDAQWGELYDGAWNGERLTRRTGYQKVVHKDGTVEVVAHRTPGFDVGFFAPKSISEAYAKAATAEHAQAIAEAVFSAAEVAWKEGVEGHVRLARVPDGSGGTKPVTAKLAATPVMQYTARPTQETLDRGAPADPHLHVHVPTFSLCKVGDRWYTADEAGIKRTAEYRDQIFMGELARRMEALGYSMDYAVFDEARAGRVTWELAGSDAALRKHWSSNHERTFALARAFELGHGRPPTDRELGSLMKVTKGKKADKEMDSNPTRERWIIDARAAGFDVSPILPGDPVEALENRYAELRVRLMGAKGLVREDAAFGAESIRPAIARCAVGLGFTREELGAYEAVLKEDLVVLRPAVDPNHVLYTTKRHIALEDFIVKARQDKARFKMAAPDEASVALAISRQDVELDTEQRNAVAAACSGSGWVHIEGSAGSGKSSSSRAIVDAHRISKTADQVVAVSVAAKTANDYGRKLEADRWGSVESVLRQIERGQIKPTDKTLWMVDEAAMMDTHRMAALIKAAGRGRVVLVGDSAQLTPIGAAGWYAESVESHGSAKLTRVFRQRDENDVASYQKLRDGNGAEAVASMAERGRVHVSKDSSERLGRVMGDYKELRAKGYKAGQVRQVIETSNHDVDTMNRFVQRDRIERNEVHPDGFRVEDTEQGRRWELHQGDQVIFLRSYYERGVDPIRNGSTGLIRNIDRHGNAVIDLGTRTVSIGLQEAERVQPVGLAYAQHAAKLQGSEVEHVQVLPSLITANANSGYSQVTRAKHQAHVYLSQEDAPEADPVEALGQRWSTPAEKRSARSYLHEPEPIKVETRHENIYERIMADRAREQAREPVGMER
ncbi:AAA family ATPase [Blastococcus sp. VKM Ac-2987]|uniref:AAA family ATPase n=1 Tax=Blastococcus sp. VKM Ac-2987 TaxID=3004141 RepID=UPI0022AB7761|nr:AAA family ATPase [Blastococcus sp. VKM Ac-2987]MCZ2857441.1 AAA family ATPase [Blastococcus sp. VKM Ac-2987]